MSGIDKLVAEFKSSNILVKDGLHYGAHLTLYGQNDTSGHSKALVYYHKGDVPIKYLIRWNRVSVANNKLTLIALDNDEKFTFMTLRRINKRNFSR